MADGGNSFQNYYAGKPHLGLQLATAARCERKLIHFIEHHWKYVEPARPFVKGWAIEAVCEHLEAVTNGEIKRLIMNVPPGFMKSLTTNVFWPAWEWGPKNRPSLRYIAAAYTASLTERDNIKFRNLVMCPLYRKLWGNKFGPSKDQFNIEKVANNKTGWKLATSVGGVGTGERGDRVVLDDPNSVAEAESEAIRLTTNQWFTEVIPTRLNDPMSSAIICIQQRTHENDVSGIALELELGYTHLMIPMEYDSTRHCVTVLKWDQQGEPEVTWEDPRGLDEDGDRLEGSALDEADGILAFPERFPEEVVTRDKAVMGEYAIAGQFQQSPQPRGGAIFKRDWWQAWPPDDWPEKYGDMPVRFPAMDYRVAALDSAFTEDEVNDFSALTIWGVWRRTDMGQIAPSTLQDGQGLMRMANETKRRLMLMYGWQKRLTLHGPDYPRPANVSDEEWNSDQWLPLRQKNWGIVEWVVYHCRLYKIDKLLIENKANGKEVAGELARLYGNEDWGVELVEPHGDKISRAWSVQHLFSNGQVSAPIDKAWFVPIGDQMSSFPRSAHDDIVDTCTMALRHLRDIGLAVRTDESEREWGEELRMKPKPKPLYDA